MATQTKQAAQVQLGPGNLYIAPVGTTEPTTLTGALNVAWVDLGYTESGPQFTFEQDIEDIEVAELKEPLKATLNSRTTQIEFAFAETTATNLKYALNGGTISTSGGVVTFTPPGPDDDLQYIALLWESDYPAAGSPKERWIFRKCLSVDSVSRENRKGADYAKYPVAFRTYRPESTDVHWVKLTAYE